MSETSSEDALARILEDIAAGRPPDKALAAFPTLRADLEPLVRVATLIARAGDVEPSPGFRSHSPRRVRAQLLPSRPAALRGIRRPSLLRPLALRPAWARVAAVVVALVCTSGLGVAYAADGSLPGDPLYGVDRAIESLRLSLTTSPLRRAELALANAEERLAELQILATTGSTADDFESALEGYGASIALAAKELAQGEADGDEASAEALAALLGEALAVQHQVLSGVRDKVPAPGQAAIDRAIEGSRATFDATEAGRPSIGDEVEAQEEGPGPPDGVPGVLPGGAPQGPTDGAPPRSPGPPSGDASPIELRISGLEAHFELARSRLQEGDLEAGRLELRVIEQEIGSLSLELAAVATQDPQRAESLARLLDEVLSLDEQVLAQLLPHVPAAAVPWLEAALAASQAGRQAAQRVLGPAFHPGPPGGLPVGPP